MPSALFVSLRRTAFFLIVGLQFEVNLPSSIAAAAMPPEQDRPPAALDQPASVHPTDQLGQAIQGILAEAVSGLRKTVENGPPFLIDERRARVDRLEKLVGDTKADPSEKYRRVLEAYRIELEYAKTVDAYRGVLKTATEERLVDFLGIGRLALYYQTLDGRESGIWRNDQRQWQRLSGEESEGVSQGLRTARKLDPPQLIVLPLPGPKLP